MNKAFLQEILGSNGATALENSIKKAPILESVIVPRTIVSWLNILNTVGYDGELPGNENSYISFVKSEDGLFTGAVTIDDSLYMFEKAELLHVAATVGVALGIDCEPINESLKSKDLTQLGKSIDLLVKSQFVKKITDNRPVVLSPPTENTQNPSPSVLRKSKTKAIKLTKKESESICEECGQKQFVSNRFYGCLCLRELAKSVKTKTMGDSFLLVFNSTHLDFQDVSAIVSAFKQGVE